MVYSVCLWFYMCIYIYIYMVYSGLHDFMCIYIYIIIYMVVS
jgi:hypothetical protein